MMPGDPPMLQYHLLENPQLVTAGLLVAAAVFILVFRTRRKRWAAIVGGVLVAAAAGLWLLAGAVITDREAIASRTIELLKLTETEDVTADRLRPMFHPDAILVGPQGTTWLELQPMLDELEAALQRYGVSNHRVQEWKVEARTARHGVAWVALRSTIEGPLYEGPTRTQWLMTWTRDNPEAPWQLDEVQFLELEGREPTKGVWR